jgi:hypothetical protein
MWMDTIDSNPMRPEIFRGPWLAIWTLALGLLVSGATVIGGNLTIGLVTFGLLVAFAAFLYFGARNETIAGLTYPRRDERWEMINQRAMAFAGTIIVLALIGGWIVELVRGNDGSPYWEIFTGGTVAYFAAALWLRSRS